jgi:hypothetical protein
VEVAEHRRLFLVLERFKLYVLHTLLLLQAVAVDPLPLTQQD